ncbi:hypothetical protein FHS18_003739 [Paenibacillus phyllosphaerae]|uniref:Alpha-galactosidase n=1 Tax=Paenibacillus phyllosphaerae TaxID=274593 RepID=A0A7W5FNT4_9BACL|nr:alpha-galactosidase [Paenibacillus phyllosphaerae]MBB3111671.1 hypothetical protein [Paenibacillus phyllosphaerae]
MSKDVATTSVQTTIGLDAVTADNGIVRLAISLTDGTYELAWQNGDRITGASGAVKLDSGLRHTTDYAQHLATVAPTDEALGRGATVTVTHEAAGYPTMEQQFTVYEQTPFVTVRLTVRELNTTVQTNYIAPVFVTADAGGSLQAAADGEALRALLIPFDNDKWVRYESIELPGSVESYEASAIYDAVTRRGLVVGSLTHDTWKTGLRIAGDTASAANWLEVFGGAAGELTRDSITHSEVIGDTVTSPLIFIGSYDDYREGLEAFGKANAKVTPALAWEGGVPFGWNSWSAAADKLDYDLYVKTSDFLHGIRNDFHNEGVVYINFDSFWTSLSEEQLTDAVAHVNANGQKAGIYWTPFTFWGNNFDQAVEGTDGAYAYRDLLLRDRAGNVLPSLDGGLSIDPTHPGNLLRTEYHLSRFVEWGFEYVKLDFLGHGAVEGKHYNTSIQTGIQAYNFGMAVIRDRLAPELIGRPFHINLSIAPLFPYQYGHSRRISCDAFGLIADTEYMLNALTNGWWMNDALYRFNDPDHTVLYKSFNQESTAYHEGRSRLTASVVAGTVMLMGDDFRNEEARKRAEEWLSNQDVLRLARKGQTFVPVEGNSSAGASDLFLLRTLEDDAVIVYLAVFNYDRERKAERAIALDRIGLSPKTERFAIQELWSGEAYSVSSGFRVELEPMESKLIRIAEE